MRKQCVPGAPSIRFFEHLGTRLLCILLSFSLTWHYLRVINRLCTAGGIKFSYSVWEWEQYQCFTCNTLHLQIPGSQCLCYTIKTLPAVTVMIRLYFSVLSALVFSLKKTLIRKKVVTAFVAFLGKFPNVETLEWVVACVTQSEKTCYQFYWLISTAEWVDMLICMMQA